MAWKIPYIHPEFYSPLHRVEKGGKIEIFTIRNSYIPGDWRSGTIAIYNGYKNVYVKIKSDMLRFKTGEFSIHIKMGFRKKKKKKGRGKFKVGKKKK